MIVANGTQSMSQQAEGEGTTVMVQEILKKLESFDSQFSIVETMSQGQGSKELPTKVEEGVLVEKSCGNTDYYQDRPTRQTKVEIPVFDGSRVHDWIFKSERLFELDITPMELRVSIASLVGLAMDCYHAFIKNRKLMGPVS